MIDPETGGEDFSEEKFDKKLEDILDSMSGAELLAIPGLYEVVREHLNNDVIKALEEASEEP